jgi:hypothetical protein
MDLQILREEGTRVPTKPNPAKPSDKTTLELHITIGTKDGQPKITCESKAAPNVTRHQLRTIETDLLNYLSLRLELDVTSMTWWDPRKTTKPQEA